MMYPSTDLMMNNLPLKPKQEGAVKVYKERKKHDRFNGMPEEEVSKRTLPDHLSHNLDIVIVSIFHLSFSDSIVLHSIISMAHVEKIC